MSNTVTSCRKVLPRTVSIPIRFGTSHDESSLQRLGTELGQHHAEIARGKPRRGRSFDIHTDGKEVTARIVLTRPALIWTVIWIVHKHGFDPVTEFRGKLVEVPTTIFLVSEWIRQNAIPDGIADTLRSF